MNHVCIRIYANGMANYTVRDDAGMESWLAYNKEARWGNSLFVDGVYVEGTGYLDGAELEAVAEFVLGHELPDPSLRRLGSIYDDIERRKIERYPDDSVLVSASKAERFMEELRAGSSPSP